MRSTAARASLALSVRSFGVRARGDSVAHRYVVQTIVAVSQ